MEKVKLTFFLLMVLFLSVSCDQQSGPKNTDLPKTITPGGGDEPPGPTPGPPTPPAPKCSMFCEKFDFKAYSAVASSLRGQKKQSKKLQRIYNSMILDRSIEKVMGASYSNLKMNDRVSIVKILSDDFFPRNRSRVIFSDKKFASTKAEIELYLKGENR